MYYGGPVARIRIIDEWLRSPVSPPSRHRAVMVVSESWSEQRVLMRAFAASRDQTRPTIVLHGQELAIGPAGTDPHGEWGIHVEPPVDGRAQELRGQLETAARRLAGSKGNPPRLVDEVSRFEDKATNMWAPGTPPDLPARAAPGGPRGGYYEPVHVAPPVHSTVIPSAASQRATVIAVGGDGRAAAGVAAGVAPAAVPAARGRRTTDRFHGGRVFGQGQGHGQGHGRAEPELGKTRPGFLPPDAPTAPVRPARAAAPPPSFVSLVGRTMPIGLQLTDVEREVLGALGAAPSLPVSEIGRIAGADDARAWMDALLAKLAGMGLDLVAPGEPVDGEPSYTLRR